MGFDAWILAILFFLIALCYSSAGFGGGSMYLALLVMVGWSPHHMSVAALLCNLLAAGSAAWHFGRAGLVRWRLVASLAALSAPMAYLGGRLRVSPEVFSFILGFTLILIALRILCWDEKNMPAPRPGVRAWLWPASAAIGWVSGLVGIGGGILLSPVLMLSGHAAPREAAGAASVFIVLNSIAGLLGKMSGDWLPRPGLVLLLGCAVLAGGQIGGYIGANRLPRLLLARITAIVLVIASFKLLGELL